MLLMYLLLVIVNILVMVWMVMIKLTIMHCFWWGIIEYNSGAVFIAFTFDFITIHYCRPLTLIIILIINMTINNMTTNRYKLKSIIVFIDVVVIDDAR